MADGDIITAIDNQTHTLKNTLRSLMNYTFSLGEHTMEYTIAVGSETAVRNEIKRMKRKLIKIRNISKLLTDGIEFYCKEVEDTIRAAEQVLPKNKKEGDQQDECEEGINKSEN